MANIVSPSGFALARGLTSNATPGQVNTYFIPSTDTNAYYIGDAVSSAAGSDTVNGYPCVTRASGADTTFVRGVIMGVLPTPAIGLQPSLSGNTPLALEQIFVPATKTKGYYVLVCDDPHQLFEVSDDGGGTTTVATIAGFASKNCTFTWAAPTGNSPISGEALTFATAPTTTATLPIKIIGLAQRVAPGGGNQLAPFARWIVKFNTHELGQSSAGI